MSAEQEEQLSRRARAWLATKIVTLPALRQYLEKCEEETIPAPSASEG